MPVFVTSATHNIGIDPVLTSLGVYVESPENRRAAWVTKDGDREFLDPPQKDSGPLAAYIFKEVTDKFGTLSFFRVFSGTIKSNDSVNIPNRRNRRALRTVVGSTRQGAVPGRFTERW